MWHSMLLAHWNAVVVFLRATRASVYLESCRNLFFTKTLQSAQAILPLLAVRRSMSQHRVFERRDILAANYAISNMQLSHRHRKDSCPVSLQAFNALWRFHSSMDPGQLMLL